MFDCTCARILLNEMCQLSTLVTNLKIDKISKVSGTNSVYTYFTDSQEISDKKVYWNREIVNIVETVKLLEK